MKLEFNPESKVKEWQTGRLHFKEGDDIEVTSAQAKRMLQLKHEVAPQQFVSVFQLTDQGKVTKKEVAESLGTFPANFPHADVLTKAGLSFDEVKVLSKDDLTKIDGIGPKSADAILEGVK